MTKLEDVEETITSSTTTTTTRDTNTDDNVVIPEQDTPITDTVAAAVVAVLAVVLILTLMVIFRALRKRRQARQGQRMDDIPTVSAGIMGAGVSAYNNIPVSGRITWEPIVPSTSSSASTSFANLHRGDNPSSSRTGRENHRTRHQRGSNSRNQRGDNSQSPGNNQVAS